MSDMDYIYKIKVTRVIDGDTVDAVVDLGFDTFVNKRIRLYGIDAPETRTRDKQEKKRGFASKERLSQIIDEQHGVLYLKSMDKGKYGRCIGVLFEGNFDDESINDMLVNEGHADPYDE